MEQMQEQLFFDPFAEASEAFSPLQSFQALFERYENKQVTHDYTADRFVADTEALLLDVQFAGRFQEMQAISLQMHALCMDDHMVRASVEQRQVGHGSGVNRLDEHAHVHGASETDEIDKRKKSKKNPEKAKPLPTGWLQVLFEQYKNTAKKRRSATNKL